MISEAPFGKVDGVDVRLYTLTNANGLVAKVSSYGAIVTNLFVPDRNGKLADVVLGFDGLAGYLKDSPYFGATVGRVANRIRGGRFSLEGLEYQVAINDGSNHLHGGVKGWDKVVWQAEQLPQASDGPAVSFTHLSPDGDEGYPGAVQASILYTLTNENELRIAMSATTDRTTIVNMVHHTYWNLGGTGSGPITAHELLLLAERSPPGDPQVPTGEERAVRGTPFDFTKSRPIGRDLLATGTVPVGYDHNFVVAGVPSQLRPVARLRDPASGRVMTLQADQPGVQFYSGNYLDGKTLGKGGVAYAQHSGLCLESQAFPDAINVPAWRGQVVLKPGETYKHTMIHRFTAE